MVPSLELQKPDGTRFTRPEMEAQIKEKWSKSVYLQMKAVQDFGLPKVPVYDMVPGMLRHYLLDELVRRGVIIGETADVDPVRYDQPEHTARFSQRLAALLASGQALLPDKGDGIVMMNSNQPPQSGPIPVPAFAPAAPPVLNSPSLPPFVGGGPTAIPSLPSATQPPLMGAPLAGSPPSGAPPLPQPGAEVSAEAPKGRRKSPPRTDAEGPSAGVPAPLVPAQAAALPAPTLQMAAPLAVAQPLPAPPITYQGNLPLGSVPGPIAAPAPAASALAEVQALKGELSALRQDQGASKAQLDEVVKHLGMVEAALALLLCNTYAARFSNGVSPDLRVVLQAIGLQLS